MPQCRSIRYHPKSILCLAQLALKVLLLSTTVLTTFSWAWITHTHRHHHPCYHRYSFHHHHHQQQQQQHYPQQCYQHHGVRLLYGTPPERMMVEVCGFKDCKSRGGGPKLQALIQQIVEERQLGNMISVESCDCQGECGYGPNIVVDGQIINGVQRKVDSVIQALGLSAVAATTTHTLIHRNETNNPPIIPVIDTTIPNQA